MISVRTLSKRHGDRQVLQGVSADVAKGETIAIVGPSGGGKSTLLRCLNYLETFDEGTVEIAGFKLRPNMGSGDAGTLRKMRQNLGWALAYNALAVPLAALGVVGPWEAAIGMAASSFIVVLNCARLEAALRATD